MIEFLVQAHHCNGGRGIQRRNLPRQAFYGRTGVYAGLFRAAVGERDVFVAVALKFRGRALSRGNSLGGLAGDEVEGTKKFILRRVNFT